jgi:hypothetical protein
VINRVPEVVQAGFKWTKLDAVICYFAGFIVDTLLSYPLLHNTTSIKNEKNPLDKALWKVVYNSNFLFGPHGRGLKK